MRGCPHHGPRRSRQPGEHLLFPAVSPGTATAVLGAVLGGDGVHRVDQRCQRRAAVSPNTRSRSCPPISTYTTNRCRRRETRRRSWPAGPPRRASLPGTTGFVRAAACWSDRSRKHWKTAGATFHSASPVRSPEAPFGTAIPEPCGWPSGMRGRWTGRRNSAECGSRAVLHALHEWTVSRSSSCSIRTYDIERRRDRSFTAPAAKAGPPGKWFTAASTIRSPERPPVVQPNVVRLRRSDAADVAGLPRNVGKRPHTNPRRHIRARTVGWKPRLLSRGFRPAGALEPRADCEA